jgi:hypothetical protein
MLTIWSQAEGFDCGNQRRVLLIRGGIILYFGWLAVWVLSPDWHGHKLKCVTFRRLGEASTPEGGDAGRAPSLHHLIPWHLPYN